MLRLHNLIMIDDTLVSREDIDFLFRDSQSKFYEGERVEIPNVALYDMATIPPIVEGENMALARESSFYKLIQIFEKAFYVYRTHNGFLRDHELEEGSYFPEFHFRKFGEGGFHIPQYDARDKFSGNRFLSMRLFLTNSETGYNMRFNDEVLAGEIKPVAGRVVIYPSNFLFAHETRPGIHGCTMVNGFLRWRDR